MTEDMLDILNQSYANTLAMRLPVYNLSEDAEKVAPTSYRKEILRAGSINYKGRKVTFTKDDLAKCVQNFSDNALDYVPFQFVDGNNNHGDDPKLYGGVIKGLSLSDNGDSLVADMNLSDDAEKIVKHNPKFGVSVKLHPAYYRESDGRMFGPTLLHVAGTHQPRITGMKPWEAIAASQGTDEENVINLSEDGQYELAEEVETMTTENDQKNDGTINLSAEDVQKMIDKAVSDAVGAKDTQIKELSDQIAGFSNTRYSDAVNTMIKSMKDSGVTPAMADAAQHLLLSFDADERKAVIELSEGEGDDQKTVKKSRIELVGQMLEMSKGTVDLSGETGSGAGDDKMSDKEEDAIVDSILQFAGQ